MEWTTHNLSKIWNQQQFSAFLSVCVLWQWPVSRFTRLLALPLRNWEILLKNTKIKEGSSATDYVADVTDGRLFDNGLSNGWKAVRQQIRSTDVTDGIGKKGNFDSFPLLPIFCLMDLVLPPRCDRTSVWRDRPQASQSMLYSSKYAKSIFKKSILQLK